MDSEMEVRPSSVDMAASTGKGNVATVAAASESTMGQRLGFLAVCKRRRRMEAESMAAQAKRRLSEKIRPEGEDASAGWGLLLAPSTPLRKLQRLTREADLDAPQDFVNLLPEALALKIFSKVPPRAIASKCSLICKSWARLAGAEGLWKDFCTPSGLTTSDTTKVLGGWRGLFAAAFAANLVQSPQFERYQENESVVDFDEEPSAFQARARVLVERLADSETVELEYRCRSHWTDDVEGLDHHPSRVNAAFRTRVTAESLSQQPDRCAAASPSSPGRGGAPLREAQQPAACREGTGKGAAIDADPVPAAAPAVAGTWAEAAGGVAAGAEGATAGAGADAVGSHLNSLKDNPSTCPVAGTEAIRTAPSSWGRLQQTISLTAFPGRFLDSCPPLRVSAWCAANAGQGVAGAGEFRMRLVLLACDGSPLHHWDSGITDWSNPGWHCFTALIQGYPPGVKSVIVKVAGKGVDYTKVQASFSPIA